MLQITERGLLFTDVVDSTLLVEQLGDESAAEVWAEHDRRARELLARYRGREIDRTDGFFLLFDDTAYAARYALAYHEALADLALNARAGLHVGPVTLHENASVDIARGAKRTEVEGLAKPRRRQNHGARPWRADAPQRRRPDRARRRASQARRDRESRPLPPQRDRGAGRSFRARRTRLLSFLPSGGCRQGLPRGARGRPLAPRARGAPQPACRARRLRRPERGAARARATARRWRQATHCPRPRRYRQDPLRAPLRLDLARRLAGRRLLLRSVRRAFARRHFLRRRLCARRPARQG